MMKKAMLNNFIIIKMTIQLCIIKFLMFIKLSTAANWQHAVAILVCDVDADICRIKCGGTIISLSAVLTAAACFPDGFNGYYVSAGSEYFLRKWSIQKQANIQFNKISDVTEIEKLAYVKLETFLESSTCIQMAVLKHTRSNQLTHCMTVCTWRCLSQGNHIECCVKQKIDCDQVLTKFSNNENYAEINAASKTFSSNHLGAGIIQKTARRTVLRGVVWKVYTCNSFAEVELVYLDDYYHQIMHLMNR